MEIDFLTLCLTHFDEKESLRYREDNPYRDFKSVTDQNTGVLKVMINNKRLVYEMKCLEWAYNLCAEEQKEIIKKELPILKLILKILNSSIDKSESQIIHLFSKIDYLHFCLSTKKTKRIHPILILQYFEYRETEQTFLSSTLN